MVEEGSIVKQTLNTLKKRLKENENIIQIQGEGGYLAKVECTFNPPATDEEIKNFERQTGLILPNDYKEFLKISNGCRLFDDIESGGEIELYSLDQIIDLNEHYDEFEGCFDIAYIYQDNIVINSKHYSELKKNYLFWKGHIDQFEEAIPLEMNFELWLDRFIISSGAKFWSWSIYTAENYYKLS
ncbi:SMI1/KNR4 family protein [Paenisporosarcina antarctica]|uniref:SMI1/KNR4 family protein n=1 Tax=Paenisporosarcina antarctica TaxID=417367 RepID=A0A4P6ZX62_9BACL|nr:SMI1/KNR4 family protein [Paenisporosarcina antarctica]QBP40982.1 SMI1/KNR4 family protein [Paenisporosarcina antarctica]